jgi:integrase
MKQEQSNRAKVIDFPRVIAKKPRKSGINQNRAGSVRNINGKVYVDFIYLGERVRENSGLPWNPQNVKKGRELLDKILLAIKSGQFRFAEVFPHSRKKVYFAAKEKEACGLPTTPDQVRCGEFFSQWYEMKRNSGRVTERTLLGYKRLIHLYLQPFFGKMTFAQLNVNVFDRFSGWAKEQRYRRKTPANETINKCFTVLKMICKSAAIEYGWKSEFEPFFGFRKLPEGDPYEKIMPFSVEEQKKLLAHLPEHWRPYFRFAFCSGLRVGEQLALKPHDIDWEQQTVHIRRAMTLNENGQRVEGHTKNRYSRRVIKLLPVMWEALLAQKEIYDRCQGEYFFCTPTGGPIHLGNLRRRVWEPALRKAGLAYREMKQTRHTFATLALSSGANPLWIAKVLGHRNTEMIFKVYGKYMEKVNNEKDYGFLNDILQVGLGNEGESEGEANYGKIMAKNDAGVRSQNLTP